MASEAHRPYKSQGELDIIRDTIKHLKNEYYEFVDGDLTVNDFWNESLSPFLKKLSRDVTTREIIGSDNARSADLFYVNLSDLVSSYKDEDNVGNKPRAGDLRKEIKVTSSKVINELDEFISSLKGNVGGSTSIQQLTTITSSFRGEKQFFVGRQDYIDKIKEYYKVKGTHISIIGPGGSGKSQLAFKAIHQCEEENIFDLVIPIYFDVGLISFSDFLSFLAKSTGGVPIQDFEKHTVEDRNVIISNILSQKNHPLIFADMYETVSAEINDRTKQPPQSVIDINFFLNNNLPPNTSILLTSRERNNLDLEKRIELEGLKEEEGKNLFTTLVREEYLKNPKGTVQTTIENLLQKTGGHPLSIEVIAKNVTSVEELEDISQSLGIREVNRGEPNERLKSLKGSFDYTLNKLDKNLKELLPKLILFKSPFPISAPVDIFEIDMHIIIEFHNRSLLTRIESAEDYGKMENPEYWLYNFHPALRNYLEDTMEKNIYLNLENEYGKKFSECYYNLLRNTYNAIGKETHVISLTRFSIIAQGKNNDFDRSIELTKDLEMSANISTLLGSILDTLGLLISALQYYKRSLDLHKKLNDRVGMAGDYKDIGLVLWNMGNYKEALDYHNKALDIDKQVSDRTRMAADYKAIGNVFWKMGNYKEALDYHNKALDIHENQNDRTRMAADYKNIGNVLWNMDNYKEALDYHNKALDIDKQLNDRVNIAKDYTNLGVVLDDMGNYKEALDYHNKALDIDKQLNDRVNIAKDYTNLGAVLDDMGNYKEALDYHNKALDIDKQLSNLVGMAEDYKSMGNVLDEMDNYKEALDYHNKALDIDKQLNDRVNMAEDHYNIGSLLLKRDNKKEALKSLFNSLMILQELEKETGYHYPLIEELKKKLASLRQDDN
jgi:tetratricopeptide (TPR) repeat protein